MEMCPISFMPRFLHVSAVLANFGRKCCTEVFSRTKGLDGISITLWVFSEVPRRTHKPKYPQVPKLLNRTSGYWTHTEWAARKSYQNVRNSVDIVIFLHSKSFRRQNDLLQCRQRCLSTIFCLLTTSKFFLPIVDDGQLSYKEFVQVMKNRLFRGLDKPMDTGFIRFLNAIVYCVQHEVRRRLDWERNWTDRQCDLTALLDSVFGLSEVEVLTISAWFLLNFGFGRLDSCSRRLSPWVKGKWVPLESMRRVRYRMIYYE